jgi:hypothetical protein
MLVKVVGRLARLGPAHHAVLSRPMSSDTFFTWSNAWMTFRLSSMRFADILESGIRAWYFASTSLHSIPRGADPRGASSVLVNRAPDLVTIRHRSTVDELLANRRVPSGTL